MTPTMESLHQTFQGGGVSGNVAGARRSLSRERRRGDRVHRSSWNVGSRGRAEGDSLHSLAGAADAPHALAEPAATA
jgi:hypothetical protein